MTDWLWAGAAGLTATGALFYWGAGALPEERLYGNAAAFLLLALFCVGLAYF